MTILRYHIFHYLQSNQNKDSNTKCISFMCKSLIRYCWWYRDIEIKSII